MDNLTKEQRKKNMCAIRSTNTKMENIISSELWNKGIRFRKNVKSLPGRPDIAIKKYKIVIFLDSCFWHKCPIHYKEPKSNKEYWLPKIERNISRDKEINEYYQSKKWNIMRIWEHEVKKELPETVEKIIEFISRSKG